MKLNLDYLLEQMWEYLALIRVYTKKPGQPPDFDDGLILRKGVTVEHVCHAIHRTLAAAFKYALVWVSKRLGFMFCEFTVMCFKPCPTCSNKTNFISRERVRNIHLKEWEFIT